MKISKILKYLILILAGIAAIFPFMWLLSTSLKGNEDIFSYPPKLLPSHFEFSNYLYVFKVLPFHLFFINSLIIAITTVVINIIVSSLAGYALAKFNFRFKNIFFFLVIAAIMIPKELIIIPLFTMILKLSLSDTLLGVILPFSVEAYSIFLMRQSFLSIPNELMEAAIMDGCSHFKIWYKIMLPITKPVLAVISLFTFIGTWGDFLWPLIVLKNKENYTLQVGLSYMMGTFVNNFRYIAAGSIIALLPVIIVFMIFQKYLLKNILVGVGK